MSSLRGDGGRFSCKKEPPGLPAEQNKESINQKIPEFFVRAVREPPEIRALLEAPLHRKSARDTFETIASTHCYY